MNELERTLMTLSCRDSDAIPKVPDAGKIVFGLGEEHQVMHNGIRVLAGGYYGDWMAHIIRGLRGHHEPQEEAVFHAVLQAVRHRSLIVELGSFWSYYSLWYLHEIPGSTAICVEPDPNNRAVGIRNAAINGFAERAAFHAAGIGAATVDAVELRCESDGVVRSLPVLAMAGLQALTSGRFIEALHIDTQGAELGFIRSIGEAGATGQIRFLLVSTHHSSISGSTSTHQDCLDSLLALGANILVEHSVPESYSGDGLIACSFMAEDRQLTVPPISRNVAGRSLFPHP